MLYGEFVAEWERQDKETQTGFSLVRGKLEHHEIAYLMGFYHRTELDDVVKGEQRHRLFVQWCRKHHWTLLRDAESAYWKMVADLQAKAIDRPIAKEWAK